jgi:uncharacterized protein (TIGR03067 family)
MSVDSMSNRPECPTMLGPSGRWYPVTNETACSLLARFYGLAVRPYGLAALGKDDVDDQPIAVPQNSPAVLAEPARLAGTWKVVARGVEGSLVDTTDRDYSVRFHADHDLLVLDGKVQQDSRFLLDPGHEPRWIDWTASIRDKDVTPLGIYEFRGDTLVIAMANAGERRPKRLAAEGLDSLVIYTLRRVDEAGTGTRTFGSPAVGRNVATVRPGSTGPRGDDRLAGEPSSHWTTGREDRSSRRRGPYPGRAHRLFRRPAARGAGGNES